MISPKQSRELQALAQVQEHPVRAAVDLVLKNLLLHPFKLTCLEAELLNDLRSLLMGRV